MRGIGPESPLPGGMTSDEADEALLDAVAGRIVRMGMAVPAVFFLESAKPLNFIGSQALVFLEPFVKSVLNIASYDRFTALMEDRSSIERLLIRIEKLDEEGRQREKEEKRRRQEAQKQVAVTGPAKASGVKEKLRRFLVGGR